MKQQCGFNTQLKADDQHLQPLTTVKFLQIANLKSKSASLPSSDCAISGKNKGVI